MISEEKLNKATKAFDKYKRKKISTIENNLKLKGIIKAKFYFPITKLLLKTITKLNGEKIYYLNKKNIKVPKGKSIIYANTHKFKPDIEKITLSLNKPSVMVASDFKNSYKTINGWYFNTRPTIFVDPYSKEDKKYTYKMMVRYLKEGNNCMIFPEAVWNLSQNQIVLDLFSGTVRSALESNSVIICTAIERYDKNYIINRKDYFDPTEILKRYTDMAFDEINNNPNYLELRNNVIKEANLVLREKLATLTYEIWEAYSKKYGNFSRKKITENYWNDFVEKLIEEWPGYKLSDNIEQQVQNKNVLKHQEIENDIEKLRKNININNLFLFTDYDRYLKAKELIQNNHKQEEVKKNIKKI